MSDPILSNLLFTKSTGRRDGTDDSTFNDAITYGGFPADFKIKGIKKIDIFSDKGSDDSPDDSAFITGLAIQYDGVEKTVRHGIVNVDNVGTLAVDSKKELIVGVFGRLKELPEETDDKRISSIGFVILDVTTGIVKVKGPFYGTTEKQSTPWASFGPVVAFQGTTKDGIGITTLGFVKTLGEAPGQLEVLHNNANSKQKLRIF